jgi:AcrR family transcriptional regulator
MSSILDAADALIAEAGYEAMGMNALAERAGISPGSLYQYFASKDAVLDALVERYSSTLTEFRDAHLTEAAADGPLDEVVGRFIDAMVQFKADQPAFWALFHGSAVDDRLVRAAAQLDEQLVARLEDILALRSPTMSQDRRRLVATVVIATTRSLLPLVLERSGAERTAAAAEMQQVIFAYLSQALGSTGTR